MLTPSLYTVLPYTQTNRTFTKPPHNRQKDMTQNDYIINFAVYTLSLFANTFLISNVNSIGKWVIISWEITRFWGLINPQGGKNRYNLDAQRYQWPDQHYNSFACSSSIGENNICTVNNGHYPLPQHKCDGYQLIGYKDKHVEKLYVWTDVYNLIYMLIINLTT